jgi:hypothetical protein
MEYLYEKVQGNYEDFASGRVLYNAQGTTSFPVRLASELYQRGKQYLLRNGDERRLTLYDPCCGGASLLTTIGILHGGDLLRIIGSDIDPKVAELAARNLSLVNRDGLNERMEQLTQLLNEFGKQSHKDALESANRLLEMIEGRGAVIELHCFQADATKGGHHLADVGGEVDMVITDVPYGDIVQWEEGGEDGAYGEDGKPIQRMLNSLLEVVKPGSVVIIVADKKQRIAHNRYNRLEKIKVGKRQAVILEPMA